jgi:hypothetical protein
MRDIADREVRFLDTAAFRVETQDIISDAIARYSRLNSRCVTERRLARRLPRATVVSTYGVDSSSSLRGNENDNSRIFPSEMLPA